MSITGRLSIVASCVLCMVCAQSARADYFGLEVVDRSSSYPIYQDPSEPEIPFKLEVCEIYAVFDNPADLVISVAFTNVSTTDPAGFFQHPLNPTNTAPACTFIPLYPTLVCDSFVTLGLECDSGASTIDPDFDSWKFNNDGEVKGGWYNSAPSNGQGDPDADGRVLVARFSYKQNKTTSGDVCLFTQLSWSRDIVEFLLEPFDCAVPGGGLSAGDPPNSACVDGTGSCFEDNVTAGCDCGPCCELVCAIDAFCCTDPWDDLCAGIACGACDVLACQDCNDNAMPDECEEEPDCNGNGQFDSCDIADGSSVDCGVADGVPDECCPGNLIGDDDVGPFDLTGLLVTWGACPDPCIEGIPTCQCPADFDRNCTVNATDLALLLGHWGPCE